MFLRRQQVREPEDLATLLSEDLTWQAAHLPPRAKALRMLVDRAVHGALISKPVACRR